MYKTAISKNIYEKEQKCGRRKPIFKKMIPAMCCIWLKSSRRDKFKNDVFTLIVYHCVYYRGESGTFAPSEYPRISQFRSVTVL